jgi:DNA-binding PadR family transcriptional regulator
VSIKYALLGILAEKDMHGYELKSRFDEKVGAFWSLNFGQIYSTLDRLEKENLVFHDREIQERRPDRKVFSITEPGRAELATWLSTPVSKVRALRDEFFIKLVFLDKSNPEPVMELIKKQKALHFKQMNQHTRKKLAVKKEQQSLEDLTTELLLDAGLFHAEADIKWLTLCETKIKEMTDNSKKTILRK